MAIRKTASSGQVLGVEGELQPKTAARDPGWREEDEDALAAENTVADQQPDPPDD